MLSSDECGSGGARKEGSRFTASGRDSFSYHPWAILCLGLLNTILLLAAIVIGVYCGKVSQQSVFLHQNIIEVSSELKLLQDKHSEVVKAQEEAQRALEGELTSHQQLKRQLEEQKTLNDGFQSQIESLRVEKTKLMSNISDIEGSCGHCLPGWVLLNSSCYFYSLSIPKKNWLDSREDCIRRGADLVVIDNWEEQELLFEYLPKVEPSSKPWWALEKGIWIGFTDIQTEMTWVWVNNVTQLHGGYWINGEPNNHGSGEDCAAIFNRGNPRKTWFDGKCQEHTNEWLCEMKPK
ncbi:C-type lectin domain family 4 member E-like isoform 2-T2 [Polymixia lowei]